MLMFSLCLSLMSVHCVSYSITCQGKSKSKCNWSNLVGWLVEPKKGTKSKSKSQDPPGTGFLAPALQGGGGVEVEVTWLVGW